MFPEDISPEDLDKVLRYGIWLLNMSVPEISAMCTELQAKGQLHAWFEDCAELDRRARLSAGPQPPSS